MQNVRVGILTFHSSYNFGANLQALAMQSAFQKRGAHAFVIDYRDPAKAAMYRQLVTPDQGEKHEKFLKTHLRLSPIFTSPDEVSEYAQTEADCVIVGSDAVFRLALKYEPRRIIKRLLARQSESEYSKITEEISPYFLNWQRNTHGRPIKISIAASSMGTQYFYLNPTLYGKLYHAISDFDFISVRDKWTRTMIRRLARGRTSVHVCPDPVFSLNDNFSIPDDEQHRQDVSNSILVSGPFPTMWRKEFVAKAHAAGLSVANLPNPESTFQFPEADLSISLPLSPLAWYGLLKDAAGFVGVRFHALVSSVANQTPAISVDTPRKFSFGFRKRNKIYDLWKRIGTPHRFFTIDEISRLSPDQTWNLLFAEKDLRFSIEYAEFAKNRFAQTIEHVLKIAS